MRNRKKNKIFKKEAVNFSKAIIIAMFLVTSIFVAGITSINAESESRAPKTIWGYISYCSGGAAVGASVIVSASGYPDETDTSDSIGAYQVDVGPDGGGTEWPDGTSFTVTATLGSWSGSNTGSVSGSLTQVDVTLNPPILVADANANPTTVVVGETVSFTGSATGGATPYTWDWDFGDGTSHSSLQNPTHSYSTTGSKPVVLTVTDACSSTDTDTLTITVNPALSCDANGPYTGTICSAVQFTGTATGGHPGYSWDWDFGDGTSHSSLQNPTHQYITDGPYTATLTVTDNDLDTAMDTASVTISTPALAAEAGGPYTGSICNPVSFSGGASGGCTPYTYSWDFGDSQSGSGQYPSHQYTSDGSYTATVTVTDGKGATDTDTASVSISTTPVVANADGPSNGCTGDPISFSGSASGGCTPHTWSWTFGDGGGSNQQNPSHTYSSSGTYTVTLTVTDDVGQTDDDTLSITIEVCLLDVDAHGPYEGLVGEPIQFTGSVSGGTPPYYYQWSFGDGSFSEIQNPKHTYSLASPPEGYPVVLYVSDSTGTSGQDLTRAHITGDTDDPVADANGPYTGYVGETIEFTGSASGGTSPYMYSWDFDDSDGIQEDSTDQEPSYIYEIPGTYTVTLTVTDDDGKTDDDTTTAIIDDEPPEDTTPPTVEITKPVNGFYIGNNRILPCFLPFIIGTIDIEVDATDDESGMDKVEFYIDGTLEETVSSSPYTWTWDTSAFFKHTIKVIAYDNAENSEPVELTVWKFL